MFTFARRKSGGMLGAALVTLLAMGFAGCAGEDGVVGAAGAAGPAGPPGLPGPPPAGPAIGNVSGALEIVPLITGVSVGTGRPIVSFRLTDENGQMRQGMTPSQIRFTIAQLLPGTGGRSSQWRSYVTRTDNPVAGFPGTTPQVQANAEQATSGTFTDGGNGTYTYQFAQDITAVPGVPYDATLTHRVALQIASLPADSNAAYTWQPASGATTGLFSREIVDDGTCNACHDRLQLHGGGRRDIQYCVTCHNPGSTDAQSGNTVDMTVMIHKIHHGAGLPSVAAGGSYYIVGFGNSVHDYSGVRWSQDIRNCQTCHDENDAGTPQAQNWRLVQNAAACGSCHDNVNFVTGAGHAAGAAADDGCALCHGPNATLYDGTLRVTEAHRQPVREAAGRYRFNILAVTDTAPNQFPSVRFSVTDPTSNNAAWNIHTAAPFTDCGFGVSRLAVDIGWNTADYTNAGTGASPAQPISLNPLAGCGGASVNNGDGSFTVTSAVAVPATQTGTLVAALEGHPSFLADTNGDGINERVAVTNAFRYAAVTGTLAARRQVVDLGKCNECHNQLSLHGNNRTDSIEVCVACHNPGATDINRRAGACATALGTDDVSIDMKSMIHRIHAGGATGVPYEVCGFGNVPHTYDFAYTGALNNCEGCHRTDTYYPVDTTVVNGPTVDAVDPALYTDDVAVSANASVCGGCHVGAAAAGHMRLNGADYNAGKDAGGRLVSSSLETCTLCHGPGRISDVKEVHNVAFFRFN